MSIRLAGIDSLRLPGNRGAQPYAEAKRIAQDMMKRAKNVEVVFDNSDSTYGRRVGVIYADGVNVNLELIKRGAAAYLPYRSKQGRYHTILKSLQLLKKLHTNLKRHVAYRLL